VPFYFRTVLESVMPEFEETGVLRVLRLLRIFRIAPFYMHMIVSTHGVVKSQDSPHLCRIFDLTWLFNFLKLGEYAEGAPLFFTTIRASYPAISIFFLLTALVAVMAGGLLYDAEMGEYRVTPQYPHGEYMVPAFNGSGEIPVHYTSMWPGM
jgi:hypothetical protein